MKLFYSWASELTCAIIYCVDSLIGSLTHTHVKSNNSFWASEAQTRNGASISINSNQAIN